MNGEVSAAVDAGTFIEVSKLVEAYDLNQTFDIIRDPIKQAWVPFRFVFLEIVVDRCANNLIYKMYYGK